MTDELERLERLRKNGTLNDDEFARAKAKLLAQEENRPLPVHDTRTPDTDGRDFGFQLVMVVIVVILFLVFLLGVAPHMHGMHWR